MSKAQPIRTRPDPPETLPGQTTTLVRADPGSAGESGTQWHPRLHAHLRERRRIVESMRLMADEARALAHEAREQSSEHLQVILDHIKDVVLTVDEEGVINTFNPT